MKLSISDLETAGMNDRQIVQLLKEIEAGQREKARIRKRKQRARPRDTRDMGDKRDTYVKEPSFFLEEEKKERRKVSIHTLDPNWLPSKEDVAYARAQEWTLDRIDIEGERFRLYHLEKRTAINSDHLTWCKWVMSPIQKTAGGQNGHGRGRPAPKDDPRSIRGALDRIFEELNGPDETGALPREADLRVIPGGRRE